jgi:hypothetical protein
VRRRRRRWKRLNRIERRRKVTYAVGTVLVIAVLGCVLVCLAAWRTAVDVHSELQEAKSTLDQVSTDPDLLLTASGRQQVGAATSEADTQLQAANSQLRSSISFDVLAWVPIAARQRSGLIQLVDDALVMNSTGHRLLDGVDALQAASHGTTISLPDLLELQQMVGSANRTMPTLDRSTDGLVGPLAAARSSLNKDDARLSELLQRADQALSYAVPFLGADGPRTYLIAAENNAEMRDQGAVLSYALLSVDNGTFSVGPAHSIGDLTLSQPAPVPMSPGTTKVFGSYQPTLLWQSTNATADFPWSGQDMAAMYRQATGSSPDGVIGLDVPLVSSILSLTGPVTVPGITGRVDSTNLAGIVLNQLYDGEPPGQLAPNGLEAARTDELASVAKAAIDQLQGEHIDLAALAHTLAIGIAGRHLTLWDAVPSFQRTISALGASGAVDLQNPTRTFHVAVENATATKLDFYVHVDLSMQVAVTAQGGAVVDTTVTVVNTSPVGAAPSYQLGPDGVSSSVAGQYVGHVYLWGPDGGTQLGSVSESGLQLSELDLSVLPGQQGSVQFQTVVPDAVRNGQLQLDLVPQPRLSPDQVSATLDAPGWTIGGPSTQSAVLSRSTTLRWNLAH